MGTRHFECRTFDLSDNSPYYSSVILAPEECKKNTQERYEIVKSEPAQSPVRRTFSADETAGASKDFECSSLQPLRYASMYKYSLLGTNHMISSRSRYDLFDSPPYISTVFRALRKCKKNTQEQYEILKFNPAKTLINQGFSAEKTARANAHFECCTFDHSDNSPCLFSSGFLSRNLLKNSLERKQERQQKIFDFEIFCVEEYQGESGGRNSQLLPKFRVRAVMTTSIPIRI